MQQTQESKERDLKLEQIRENQQLKGGEFNTVEPNRIENLRQDKEFEEYIKERFPKGYKVIEHEQGYYHVLVESRTYDRGTGRKLSRPRLDKINPRMFDQLEKSNHFAGSTVMILHNPLLKRPDKSAGTNEPDAPKLDEGSNQTPVNQNEGGQEDVKSELPKRSELQSKNRKQLAEFINANLAEGQEPVSESDAKPALVEEAEMVLATRLYEAKFEELPAEEMTAEEIFNEL